MGRVPPVAAAPTNRRATAAPTKRPQLAAAAQRERREGYGWSSPSTRHGAAAQRHHATPAVKPARAHNARTRTHTQLSPRKKKRVQQRTLTPALPLRFLCAWPSPCRAAAPWAHCPPAARPPARPLPILAGILLPRSCLWALVFAKRNEGAPITGTAAGARARCTARSGQPGKGSSSCQGAHSPYGLFCPSLRGKRKRARPGDRSRFFFHGGAPRPTEATAAPARRSGRPPCCGFSPSPSSPVCPLASPLALPDTSKSQASGQRAGLEKFSRWDPPCASHLRKEGRARTVQLAARCSLLAL